MEFRVLGPLEAVDAGRPVALGRRKQRALLGLLLLHPNEALAPDRLIEELWSGRPPAQAALSLQAYVSNLRRILDPQRTRPAADGPLALRAGGYVLSVDPERIDAHRFERLVRQGREAAAAGDLERADAAYAEGLALWRGEVLADLAGDLPPQPAIARLTELRLSATEERTEVGLALGRHTQLVSELEALVMRHPLRERLREQLALALYRSGRQADALAALRDGRTLLREELGIDPGPGLQRLEQLILHQSAELDWQPRAGAAGGAATGSGDARPRLVGREDELRLLERAWQEAEDGRGRVVLIAGEPGIGKTRLAEELTLHAGGRGGSVYWGRSFEAGGAPAFWPWMQALAEIAEDLDAQELARLLGPRAGSVARLVPEIGERLDSLEPDAGDDAAEARFRLYDGVSRFLLRLAGSRPLAIVLDDLHWADGPSLDLLTLLAVRLREARLLVVCTLRDTQPDRGDALVAALATLARAAPVERLALTGLAVSAVAELLDDQLGFAAGREVAHEVHARTDGNPFFVSEVVQLLRGSQPQAGGIATDAWRRIPAGVREVIERRVRLLGSASAQVLEAAAVAGREFETATLGRALGGGPVAVLEALEPASAAGLVVPADDDLRIHRFAHALVRETLYDGLPRARRARLHGAIGEALEQQGGDRRLSEIAHHYEQAVAIGFAERAIDASLRAADHAQRAVAFEQAEGHLRSALRMLADHPDPARELAAQSRLAALLVMTQGYTAPELPAVADRVHELAPAAGTAPEVADVMWAVWTYTCVRAEFRPALRIADELIERGRRTGDRAATAAGLQARGTTLWHLGRIAEAVQALQEAIATGAELDDEEFRRRSLQHPALIARTHASHALWLLGDEAAAERVIMEARRLADTVGTPYERAFARHLSGWHAAMTRRFEEAERWCREAHELTREHGFTQLRAFTEIMLGAVEAHLGRGRAGVERLRDGLAAFSATGSRMLGHFHNAVLAEALLAAGEADEARAAVDAALDESRRTGETFYLAEVMRLRSEVTLATGGDPEEARACALEALEIAREQGARAIADRIEATLGRIGAPAGTQPA